MKIIFVIGISIFIFVIALGIIYFLPQKDKAPVMQNTELNKTESTVKLLDFSKINSEFLFSAKIPKGFEVEYIPQLKAINIYDPSLDRQTNIEKSQLYISFFKASKFLTLSTVDITRQDKAAIKGHEAILYEITKKDGVPNFAGQPIWRNFKHQALDIRLTSNSPSYFYSFAHTPDLQEKLFNDIMDSLVFMSQTD